VDDCDPAAFTLATAPARFAERGDASAGIDSAAGSLDALLELSASQEAAGSETRRGRRTIRSKVTSRRASRRHAGRPRAPALIAAATVSPPSRSSPSPRRRVRRTRSPASNGGRSGIRKRRRGCTWTMSSSTRCAADQPTGLASGSICATFPRASARQKIRPNLTMIPGPRRRPADYGRARRKRGPAHRRA